MTVSETILVATCGQGIMRSTNRGESWTRLPIYQDIEYDDIVRTLHVHPLHQNIIYAGFQCGVAKSEDAGRTWVRLSSFIDNYAIWKLVIDPKNPENIYVGTGAPTRAIAARSRDGGKTFERLPLSFPERCEGVSKPRLLAMAVDPEAPNNIWAGAEEGGLFHSQDYGDNWRRVDTDMVGQPLMHTDIHDIVVIPGNPKRIVVSTVVALHISEDEGKTWSRAVAREAFGHRYSRNVAFLGGPEQTLLYACADATPGTQGFVFRSDNASSWTAADLGSMPKTCPWAFGVNAVDPNRVLVGTKFGELFDSADGGRTFTKHWREFSEICAVAWVAAA